MTTNPKRQEKLLQFCQTYLWQNPLLIDSVDQQAFVERADDLYPGIGAALTPHGKVRNQSSLPEQLVLQGRDVEALELVTEALNTYAKLDGYPRDNQLYHEIMQLALYSYATAVSSRLAGPEAWKSMGAANLMAHLDALANAGEASSWLANAIYQLASDQSPFKLFALNEEGLAKQLWRKAKPTDQAKAISNKNSILKQAFASDLEFLHEVLTFVAERKNEFAGETRQDVLFTIWKQLPVLKEKLAANGDQATIARFRDVLLDGLGIDQVKKLKDAFRVRRSDVFTQVGGIVDIALFAKNTGVGPSNKQLRVIMDMFGDIVAKTGKAWTVAYGEGYEALKAQVNALFDGVAPKDLYKAKMPEEVVVANSSLMDDRKTWFGEADRKDKSKAMMLRLSL
ncbi:hypothetical protein ACYPKM_03325 [Pseudomonas aeruginosa]